MDVSPSTSNSNSNSNSGVNPPPSKKQKTGPPKYRRSRNGCLSCRNRHVRCAEEKPVCSNCERLGLPCAWKSDVEDGRPRSGSPSQPPEARSAKTASPAPALVLPPAPNVEPYEPTNSTIWLPHLHLNDQHHNLLTDEFSSFSDVGISHVAPADWLVWRPPAVALELGSFGDDCEDPSMNSFWESMIQGGALDGAAGGNGQEIMPPEMVKQLATATATGAESAPSPRSPLDDRLVSHFLENMAHLAVMREDSDSPNYYHQIYAKALHNPPLFASLLALSAMHLSRVESATPNSSSPGDPQNSSPGGDIDLGVEARDRYTAAEPEIRTAVMTAQAFGNGDIESLLACVLMTAEYQMLQGASHRRIQDQVAIALNLYTGLKLQLNQLGPTTQRICVILSSLDTRAALFGCGDAQFVFLLAQQLEASPSTELPVTFQDLLTINCFTARISVLDKKFQAYQAQPSPLLLVELFSDGVKLNSEIPALIQKFDACKEEDLGPAPLAEGPLRVEECNRHFTASLFNTSLIYLSRVLSPLFALAPSLLPPSEQVLRTPTEAARRVVLLNLKVLNGQPDPLRSLWPRSLFFAAIELKDPLYVDYCLKRLAATKENAGLASKTYTLLLDIIQTERTQKGKVDILQRMKQTTGMFLI